MAETQGVRELGRRVPQRRLRVPVRGRRGRQVLPRGRQAGDLRRAPRAVAKRKEARGEASER